jgi:hypothetical protein
MKQKKIQNISTVKLWVKIYFELIFIADEYYQFLNEEYKNKIILSEEIHNIDLLRFKVQNAYFTNIFDFITDVNYLFKFIHQNINNLIKITTDEELDLIRFYITNIYLELLKDTLEHGNKFKECYEIDITELMNTNKLPKISKNNYLF